MKKVLAGILFVIIIIAIIITTKNNSNSKIEYELQEVKKFSYVKYLNGEEFGVMDRQGNTIIKPAYSKIDIPNPEIDVFVCYDENNKTKVFNSKGEELFTQYTEVQPIKLKNVVSVLSYEKSVLKYKKDDKYGLMDFNGKEITRNEYASIENLEGTEGKFVIEKDGKYGVMNLNGNILVEMKYDKIETDGYYSEETKYLYSGFIVLNTTEDGYRYGYINYKGDNILETEYNNIIRIQKEDVYLIVSKSGKFGLYNNNKELIKPDYQSISYTDNGAIIIEKNAKLGIADLSGEIKVETKYNTIEEEGIYLYAQNERSSDVYDTAGNKIEMNFSKAIYETENANYRITTLINNEEIFYGIDSKDGHVLVNPSYKYIEYIFDDYFLAEDENGKYGIMNGNGDKKLDFQYDLIQKIKDKNIIMCSTKKSKEVDFYTAKLEKVETMKSAKTDSKNNYLIIYNDDEKKLLDNDGNKLDGDSDIIKNEIETELPDSIGIYRKFQYSLDDVYYSI